MNTPRAVWNNQFGFMMSAAGSAVGLGNIWKFPYITGMNGGGFFVLFYLLCIVCVALPVMIAEIYIGQKSRSNAVNAFCVLEKRPSSWKIAGMMGVLATILILSFYAVVGSWIFYFLQQSIFGFERFATREGVQHLFLEMTELAWVSFGYQLVFILATFGVVAAGVTAGIERLNKTLIPGLVCIIVLLLLYSSQLSGFSQACKFLFAFNMEAFTAGGMLEAVGHSFFTVSAGVGIMITYGSYLRSDAKIAPIAGTIVIVDTLVALASGVIIFTIVFSEQAAMSEGPVLIFKTLPLLFAQIPGGQFIAVMFFLLVTFTALTSSVSLVEVPVAYLSDKGMSRKAALSSLLCCITCLSFFCFLSVSAAEPLTLFGLTVFDLFDQLSSKVLLPISGFLFVLFFGYKLKSPSPFVELYPAVWVRAIMKVTTLVVAPSAIALVAVKLLLFS